MTMTFRPVVAGTTDVSVIIRIVDSTDGTPETGVVFNTSGIDIRYRRDGATDTAITEATLSALSDAHSDGGFLHIGNGYYRVDLPDAACASGVNGVLVHGTVTGMVVIGTYVPLWAANPYDSVRMGMTSLPNAAAAASGGLFTRGTGAGQINQAANGQIDVNVTHAASTAWGSGAITAGVIATDAIGAAELASDAVVEIAAGVWDRVISGANHNITNSAGKRLREITNSVITSGTAQGGGAASITLASAASSTDGTYDPGIVRISAGTGLGQARLIIQYVGSTRVASVDRDWRVQPDSTSEYEIVASQNLISTNEGLATGGGANSITLNANASSTTDAYRGQVIVLRTGTGQDQARLCTAYNGTTKVATVGEAWSVNPAPGTGYIIWPLGRALVAEITDSMLDAINAEVDTAIETYHLDHLLATTYDPASKPGAADALLNELVESDSGVARFTANALEQAPTGGGGDGGLITSGTAAAIADGTITLAGGHGVTNTTVMVVLTGGTNAVGKSRIATYSGTGNVFNVDPAWNGTINGVTETTPSGTITYEIYPAPMGGTTYPPHVDVIQIGGDAQSATDLKDFADAGYDPSTNKVQGVVTTDTATAVTTVNGLAANVITAAATASDFGTEVGTAVWATTTRTLSALDEDTTTLDLDATIRAAVGLASANLDTQLSTIDTVVDTVLADTNDIQTRIPAALVSGRIDASVGAMAANVMTAAAAASDLTTELQSGLATASALATVDGLIDQILALLDDARTEPGQGTPPVNPDLATKIDYLYKAWRNRSTQTSSTYSLYADDGTTVDQKASLSDNGTTFDKGEVATGP